MEFSLNTSAKEPYLFKILLKYIKRFFFIFCYDLSKLTPRRVGFLNIEKFLKDI